MTGYKKGWLIKTNCISMGSNYHAPSYKIFYSDKISIVDTSYNHPHGGWQKRERIEFDGRGGYDHIYQTEQDAKQFVMNEICSAIDKLTEKLNQLFELRDELK